MTPLAALRAALFLLALAAVAWLLRTRRWRERRLWPITLAVVAGLLLISRRVGLGELLVIATVALVPALLFAPRR